MSSLQLIALCDFPLVKPGDDLAALIQQALQHNAQTLCDGDILVLAQKIVSKAENRYRALNTVTPTTEAEKYAAETGKDPRMIELVLQESKRVLRHRFGSIVVEHKLGFVHANAGIDQSNLPDNSDSETALLLPENPDASAAARWQMRLLLAVSQISTFLLAGWMTLRLLYPPAARSLDYLKARHFPDIRLLLPGLLLMLVSMPFVMYLYEINKALPLPELFRSMEDKTAGTLRELLRMDTSLELWANLGLIALLPALGEELVFRGVLQQQLLRRFRYPWEAMLLAAAIFSFAHLQFEGFLPRMALGLVLGWLYWRTGNFWIPAAAHFVNNGAQVLAQFLYSRGLFPFDLEQDIVVFWPFALASLLLALALMYWINHICRRQTLLPS